MIPSHESYPIDHTLTVMGLNIPDFPKTIINLLSVNQITVRPESIQQKLSANDKYISLTIRITIQSQQQLEKLYKDLHNSHMVKYLL